MGTDIEIVNIKLIRTASIYHHGSTWQGYKNTDNVLFWNWYIGVYYKTTIDGSVSFYYNIRNISDQTTEQLEYDVAGLKATLGAMTSFDGYWTGHPPPPPTAADSVVEVVGDTSTTGINAWHNYENSGDTMYNAGKTTAAAWDDTFPTFTQSGVSGSLLSAKKIAENNFDWITELLDNVEPTNSSATYVTEIPSLDLADRCLSHIVYNTLQNSLWLGLPNKCYIINGNSNAKGDPFHFSIDGDPTGTSSEKNGFLSPNTGIVENITCQSAYHELNLAWDPYGRSAADLHSTDMSTNPPSYGKYQKGPYVLFTFTNNCLGPYTKIPKIISIPEVRIGDIIRTYRGDLPVRRKRNNSIIGGKRIIVGNKKKLVKFKYIQLDPNTKIQKIIQVKDVIVGDIIRTSRGDLPVSKIMKSHIIGGKLFVKFTKNCLGKGIPYDDLYITEAHPISLGLLPNYVFNNGIPDPNLAEYFHIEICASEFVNKLPGIVLERKNYDKHYNLIFDIHTSFEAEGLDITSHNGLGLNYNKHRVTLTEGDYQDKSLITKDIFYKPFMINFKKLLNYKPEGMDLQTFIRRSISSNINDKIIFMSPIRKV